MKLVRKGLKVSEKTFFSLSMKKLRIIKNYFSYKSLIVSSLASEGVILKNVSLRKLTNVFKAP